MVEKINILDELKEAGAEVLIKLDNKNYFFVPDGYFNNLSSNILAEVFIQSLPAENTYTVPGSYFRDLPDIILEKINSRKELPAPGIEEKHLYAVPEGYFNNFADNVLKKIKASTNLVQQELEEISPVLSKIPKTNVYSVSANYFEELDPLIVINDNNSKPQVKVIPINRNRARKWINYAAAACVAAVLFGSGYFYFFNNNNNSKSQDGNISNLAKMNVQQEISVLSDDEILNYLKDNNNMAVYTSAGNEDAPQQNTNMQILLQNISDEEIQEYLNDEPEVRKIEGI